MRTGIKNRPTLRDAEAISAPAAKIKETLISDLYRRYDHVDVTEARTASDESQTPPDKQKGVVLRSGLVFEEIGPTVKGPRPRGSLRGT